MPKPLSPAIAQKINQHAATFCNFFYEHPEDAIQHAISALDNIMRDYESTYGMMRGIYTKHPEKLSTTKAALSRLNESYRSNQDSVNTAQNAITEIINFLKRSSNWSKGKQMPYTSVWLLYPSINNRFVAHVMIHAGATNTEDLLEEVQDYFLMAVRTEADRRAREEQQALQELIARHSPRAATTTMQNHSPVNGGEAAGAATVDEQDPAVGGLPTTTVQSDTRNSSPWNDGTATPPLRFTPPPPPATPDGLVRDGESNVAVIFDMHDRDETGQGLTKRRGYGFNE